MKLILASGVIAKARRFVSASSSVQEEEVKDPSKLAEVIRRALTRVSDIESRLASDSLEFECNVGASGAITTIAHGFKGPVRWWVTSWLQQSGVTYPVLAPALVQDSSTVTGSLALRSYVTGRAVIRIEPAQADLDPGITVPYVAPAALATAYTALAANTSINIAAYATLLSASITTATGSALNISWSAAATNPAACSVFYQVVVDGVVKKGSRADIVAGGSTGSSMVLRVTGLSPGAHTVLLQWKTNVNGAVIHAATVVEEHAHLLVQETA